MSKLIRQSLLSTLHDSTSDIVLHDKPFSIVKNPKYNQYEQLIPSMVYKFYKFIS